jgi:alanyl-tRNA synthetase
VNTLIHEVSNATNLRDLAASLVDKIKPSVVVLTAKNDGKAVILVASSKDVSSKFPANKILNALAPLINGRGGGKPEMAQAGGDNVDGLNKLKQTLQATLMTL